MQSYEAIYQTPGAFSWNELGTSDPQAAKAFYGRLFGWSFDTMAMGEQGDYHLIKVGETSVGGIMQTQQPGQPSMWGSYVTVADCDATAALAKELGGVICAGPFDIPNVGRMVVIQDPQGAVIQAIAYTPPAG
ncbi:MAG: VOC family protein [Burkholderiaceae bacterium]|nr:VOC family protein [Burkholderiaceae bacterium]